MRDAMKTAVSPSIRQARTSGELNVKVIEGNFYLLPNLANVLHLGRFQPNFRRTCSSSQSGKISGRNFQANMLARLPYSRCFHPSPVRKFIFGVFFSKEFCFKVEEFEAFSLANVKNGKEAGSPAEERWKLAAS